MEYIKETLKKITTNELVVQPVFQFLQEIVLSSSQQDKFSGFRSRWQNKLHPSLAGSFLCYFKGCWLPKVTDQREIRRQLDWDIFAEKYVARFSGSTVGSQESSTFLPRNFEDLLQILFWEELYNLYGSQVVAFILEKCLVLLPLGECFYNCIGREGSLLQKNFNEYICSGFDKSLKKQRQAPVAFPNGNRKVNPMIKGFRNPYETGTATVKIKENEKNGIGENNVPDCGPSRKRKSDTVHVNDQIKRRKTSSNAHAQPVHSTKECHLPVLLVRGIPEPKEIVIPAGSSIPKPLPRWVTPSREVIKCIREDREKLKNSKNAATTPTPLPSLIPYKSSQDVPTFVNIMNDKYFKGKLNFITKEVYEITPSTMESIPIPKLAGLRLPQTIRQSAEKIQIVVHRLSETAAQKYNLAVKPRKRRRQKKTAKELDDDNIQVIEKTTVTPSSVVAEIKEKHYKWSPFDPAITLNTGGILFNRKAICTWPNRTHMKEVCSPSLGFQGAVSFLQRAILEYHVSASTTSLGGLIALRKIEADGGLQEMQAIFTKFTLFHRRIKNVEILVRNCVKFWIFKQGRKLAEKQTKKLAKKEQRKLEATKKIQVIDLTENTPTSDTTTTFSKSPSMNSSSITSPENNASLEQSAISDFELNDSKTSNNSKTSETRKENKKSVLRRLHETVRSACVLSTISQILYLSGGIKLLGSNANIKAFFRFLKKSIFKAGIKSCLHLGQLMALINPNRCSWLDGVEDYTLKTHLLAKVVSWLFSEYILNLLKVGFYITDASNSRMQVVFFLRDTWASVSDRLKYRYTQLGKLSKALPDKNGGMVSPTGKMRLIPKKNNHVRPIYSLTRKVKATIDFSQCKLLLNYLMMKIAPHGVTDGSAIRELWRRFLKQWKTRRCPKLYFIRVDIRDAFPSVNLSKLKEILLEAKGEQLLVKTINIVGGGKQRTKESLANGALNRDDYENWYSCIWNRPCIIQDSNKDKVFDSDRVLSKIFDTLVSSVIRLGKNNFKFLNGLPQGWALSQALCNIYYGHMDRACFSEFLGRQGEFLVRSVDDYFYISPNPQRIAGFFQRMKRGMPDYHCTINPDKSLSNIYVNSNSAVGVEEWVPFCGWRFCLTNGHVSRDFSTYADQDICSTLTFVLHSVTNPENFIFNRMGSITPVRLKYIVLDPGINCRRRILTTIFEASLMMAFRFYAICRVVYPSLNVISDPARSEKLLEAVAWCATKLNRYVRRNNTHLWTSSNLKPLHNCNRRKPCCGLKPPASKGDRILFGKENNQNVKLNEPIKDAEDNLLQGVIRKRNVQRKKLGEAYCNGLLDTVGRGMPEHFQNIKI